MDEQNPKDSKPSNARNYYSPLFGFQDVASPGANDGNIQTILTSHPSFDNDTSVSNEKVCKHLVQQETCNECIVVSFLNYENYTSPY